MGVSHSMDDGQVLRISKAFKDSANAIQGINKKFDDIDVRVAKMNDFNAQVNARVEGTLNSFQRLDHTFNDRAELALEAFISASANLETFMETAVTQLQQVNLRKELDQLPKAVIPLAIPLIVLLIELAVANAYMGILLASLPTVKKKYSEYLLINASSMLLGLTLSLLWLFLYRAWLSMRCRNSPDYDLKRLQHKNSKLEDAASSDTESVFCDDDSEDLVPSCGNEVGMERQQSPGSAGSRPTPSNFSQKHMKQLEQRRTARLQKAECGHVRSPLLGPATDAACAQLTRNRTVSDHLDVQASSSNSQDRSLSSSDQTELHARAASASANLLAAVEEASALAGTGVFELAGVDSLSPTHGQPARIAASSGQDEELQTEAGCVCTPLGSRNLCQPLQSSGAPSQRNPEEQSRNKPYEFTWIDPLHMDVTWSGLGRRHAEVPPGTSGEGTGQEAARGRTADVHPSQGFRTRSMSI